MDDSCDTKRDCSCGSRGKAPNYLITGVTLREIVLSGLGALMEILSVMSILNGFGQLADFDIYST